MGITPTLALKAKNGYLCHEKRGSAPVPIHGLHYGATLIDLQEYLWILKNYIRIQKNMHVKH